MLNRINRNSVNPKAINLDFASLYPNTIKSFLSEEVIKEMKRIEREKKLKRILNEKNL